MIGLITRFLPNLIPGLGALANPWVLLGLLGALVGSFLFGVHMEAAKLDAFQAKVTAAGEAQNARTAQRIKDDKAAKQEADNAYKNRARKLAADNVALVKCLQVGTGCGFVPAAPAGTPSPDRATVSRAELDAALRKFTTGTAGLIGEGDKVTVGLDTAKNWAAKTLKVEKELKWYK